MVRALGLCHVRLLDGQQLRLQRLIESQHLMPQLATNQDAETFAPRQLPAARDAALRVAREAVCWEWQVFRLVFGDDHRLLWKFDEFHLMCFIHSSSPLALMSHSLRTLIASARFIDEM